MLIQPIITALQATLSDQGGLTAADPAVEAAVAQLATAIGPALRIAALEIAEQAAAEVRAQLPEHTVDVVLSDGDPALRIGDAPASSSARPNPEDLDARITLRLPPSLKELIEDAAQNAGDSVNAWVIEALGKRARTRRGGDKRFNESFDL
jgi:hypothetical protein